MCLAIPGKLISVQNTDDDEIFRTGKVSFDGITKDVNLSMVPEACVGDYILVHVGIAISVVDEEEALKTLIYIKEAGELADLDFDVSKEE